MKTKHILLLCLALVLSSCASPSDPTFMNNNSAAIHGGLIASPTGAMMMSSGLQNRNRVHPFYGTP